MKVFKDLKAGGGAQGGGGQGRAGACAATAGAGEQGQGQALEVSVAGDRGRIRRRGAGAGTGHGGQHCFWGGGGGRRVGWGAGQGYSHGRATAMASFEGVPPDPPSPPDPLQLCEGYQVRIAAGLVHLEADGEEDEEGEGVDECRIFERAEEVEDSKVRLVWWRGWGRGGGR